MRDNPDASITNRILKHFWPALLEHVNRQKKLLPDYDNLKPFSEQGSWGNVYPTFSENIVLKITVNDKEEKLVDLLMKDPQEGFIRFFDILKLQREGYEPSWAIWREEISKTAEEPFNKNRQRKLFSHIWNSGDAAAGLTDALHVARRGRKAPANDPDVQEMLEYWWRSVNAVKATDIGKSLIHFAKNGWLFTDLPPKNIGWGKIGKKWKIIDCHQMELSAADLTVFKDFLEKKMKMRSNPEKDEILFTIKKSDSFHGVSAIKMHEVAQRYVVGKAMKTFVERGIVIDSLEFEVEEAIEKASHLFWKTKNTGYEEDEKVLSALQDMIDDFNATKRRDNPMRKNPSNSKLGYYLADGNEFSKIVHKGMMTTLDPEFGRVFFFTTNPYIALAKKGKRDQLIRFTCPADAQPTHRSIYDYNKYAKRSPLPSDIEVFVGGDINDEDSWAPVALLK